MGLRRRRVKSSLSTRCDRKKFYERAWGMCVVQEVTGWVVKASAGGVGDGDEKRKRGEDGVYVDEIGMTGSG